ncbi:MAG: YidC/Oxa1 family rane protein insertase [Solirubrobacteraceae bacterium]|nr:YidC/Oxa1 family rane protein insertase [Solirubrobacteraceae bacterium]
MLVFANVLQPLIDIAKSILDFFHNDAGFSWGFSIIALTLVVRAALIPLTLKQFKSMQALQRLQPEMKKLQAKYKDDKQRLNQEMMKFYQENKVNPLGSCLPLAFQMPVFIALFYMLRKDLRLDICPGVQTEYQMVHHGLTKPCGAHNGADFLFIPDLTNKATGAVLVVLVLAYVGSQLASSLLMSVTADRNQRILFTLLPVFFVIFIIRFPAGLLVYWITTNLWTIVQQYIVKRTVGPIQPAAATAGGAGGDGGGGGRGGGGGPPDGKSPDGGKSPKGGKGGERELAGVGAAGAKPPPPPRRKKKRSGRRR